MSDVTATCKNGHKWKADKRAEIRTVDHKVAVIRIVSPKTCPACQSEWIATYEKNDRRAS